MATDQELLAELKSRLLSDPNALAEVVIRSLIPAGAEEHWDSGTIERVLTPLQARLGECSLPLVGIEELEANNYWRSIGRAAGVTDEWGEEFEQLS